MLYGLPYPENFLKGPRKKAILTKLELSNVFYNIATLKWVKKYMGKIWEENGYGPKTQYGSQMGPKWAIWTNECILAVSPCDQALTRFKPNWRCQIIVIAL